jgi:hypothetical protein
MIILITYTAWTSRKDSLELIKLFSSYEQSLFSLGLLLAVATSAKKITHFNWIFIGISIREDPYTVLQ